MARILDNRLGHWLLISVAAALLFFPNLGVPSLWDIDEGNNAEAAREMMESGNWIVPTFNYQLRVDKPALLYWLQVAAFRLLGTNELAARLPSALAAWLTLLLVYELGRHMFDARTGLLAAIVQGSTIGQAAAAHFANPDALLNACTILAIAIYWHGFASKSRWWFVGVGLATGLAVLAKGLVGILLPGSVIALHLLWTREIRRLWDRQLLAGLFTCAAVALPWYVWVTNDTKASFLQGFIGRHHVGRFLNAMENHRGPVYYYLLVLLVGFAPWSALLGPATWFGLRKCAREDGGDISAGYRLLWSWIAVYFVFFSAAATKLPNYVLPAYAPLAIMTGRLLERWRTGGLEVSAWMLRTAFLSLLLIGLVVSGGFLVAGGAIVIPGIRTANVPGLGGVAVLGLIPVMAAIMGMRSAAQGRTHAAVATLCIPAVLFTGGLAVWISVTLDQQKAPKALVQESHTLQRDQEIRVGCYQYFQPSLVFYCQREVLRLENDTQALEFLRSPLPVFLYLPQCIWSQLETRNQEPCRVVARHYDLYRRLEVVVVYNGKGDQIGAGALAADDRPSLRHRSTW